MNNEELSILKKIPSLPIVGSHVRADKLYTFLVRYGDAKGLTGKRKHLWKQILRLAKRLEDATDEKTE